MTREAAQAHPSEETVQQERVRVVREALLRASVLRTVSLYEQSSPDMSFADFFEKSTAHSMRHEEEGHGQLYAAVERRPAEERDEVYQELKQQLEVFYQDGGAEEVVRFLQRVEEGFAPAATEMQHQSVIHGAFEPEGYPLPKSCGYDVDGPFMELHIENLFEHGADQKGMRTLLKEALGEIARAIVTEHPETQAVVGTSWLLDTSLAHRLGFHVLEPSEFQSTRDSHAYRGQMVHLDGTLDPDLLERYARGEPLPHPVRRGHIPVKEFLATYLPDDMRQAPVTLLHVIPERAEKIRAIRAQGSTFEEALLAVWPKVLRGATTVEDVLARPDFVLWTDFLRNNDLLSRLRQLLSSLADSSVATEDLQQNRLEVLQPQWAAERDAYRAAYAAALRAYGYTSEEIDFSPATSRGTQGA